MRVIKPYTTMKTIRDIYKIGVGPSSSHTMGPQKAAAIFNERYPDAARFEVTLYGSLAATGKGHMTDWAILNTLQAPTEIVWKPEVMLPFHPNGMLFKAFDEANEVIGEWQVFSIGGGNLAEEGKRSEQPDLYPLTKMTDILDWCERRGRTYWEYVYEYENQKDEARLSTIQQNAMYFDAAYFAERIRIPVRLSVGYADESCAPHSVLAAYNAIPSTDKRLYHGIGGLHSSLNAPAKEIDEWLGSGHGSR